MKLNPTLLVDGYKLDHRRQYPPNTTRVYSNLTPRGSRLQGVNEVITFGLQAFLIQMDEAWTDGFFKQPLGKVLAQYQRRIDAYFGPNNIGTDHIEALHNLGYLPLEFRAIPEGTRVPLRIPLWTVENTHDDFFWLVNYIETYASAETWHPLTSATIADRLRQLLDKFAEETSDTPELVDFQAHDFSYRGLTGSETAAASSAGHLLSFAGTDTVPAMDWIEYNYDPSPDSVLGVSVPATEHSVMSAGGKMSETETFNRLLDLYPTGIVSVVSDTWDLWNVLTNILPTLKDKIMARDGKLVIRPDSGDPVDIICGTQVPRSVGMTHDYPAHNRQPSERNKPEEKGVIELLWDEFGGTINSKGYRVLDEHVGAIYGDSITYERAKEICVRLEDNGFASTNIVFGVGSFTYQYVTRDTFGMAMKATWAMVDGEPRNLFKDPVTDDGLKRSATGRLAVFDNGPHTFLELVEEATPEQEASPDNLLRLVYRDGEFLEGQGWDEIVDRVGNRSLR